MPGSVIGAGLGLLGANKAAKQASRDRKLQKEQMDRLAQVKFQGQNVSGFGGAGVDFSNGGAQLNMGQFGGANQQFLDNGQMFAGQQGGLQNMMNMNQQRAMNAAGPFQQGLQNSFFGGAQQFADRANQGFDATRDQSLALMREQSQPFDQRAFTGMLDNQFATGRLGSSGGALQTEAFARGLGQVDLDRQLAATGQAQQLQSQQAGLAQQFGQAGSGLAGMGDQLFNNAMSQFGNSQGMLGQNQNQQLGALSGQQNIMQMLMGMGTFGGNLGANAANTDIGAAGGAMQGANAMSQQAGPGDIQGMALGQLGQNVSGMGNPFAGMFGGTAPKPAAGPPGTQGGFG